jgi:serine/threonine protein kinase
LSKSSSEKITFELTRAYPIGCTLNSIYGVTGIICSTGRYNLYKARDRRAGRTVTIKELTRAKISREAQADLFQSEIRAFNRVKHPNLPLMLDHFSDRGNLYIVFEHATGMCLGEMLSAEGPLPAEMVFPIFLEITDALSASHEAGVVHNELTPSSIFLLGDNDSAQLAKLTDFGGATIKDDAVKINVRKTFRPEYASPEALRGEETDERSDIYSIGVVLYTTLTGRLPFSCGDVNELIENQMKGLPRRFKEAAPELEIPFHVEATVFKCLAKDKEDRFQSAQVLAKWLRSWRHASQPVEAEPQREFVPVQKSYTIADLNSIGAPKRGAIKAASEIEPPPTIVLPDTSKPSPTVAAQLKAPARKAKTESSLRDKTNLEAAERAKAKVKAKQEAREIAERKEMGKAAKKLQERSLRKREVPIYLLAAVMVGAIGFIATVNIRHAMNAKEAEREAFTLQERMPEISRRLIAAKEITAKEESMPADSKGSSGSVGSAGSAISDRYPGSSGSPGSSGTSGSAESVDSNAVNQEAPEVPVKPGDPVQFEGEPPYRPQSVQSTVSQAPRRRKAYQTSYSVLQ